MTINFIPGEVNNTDTSVAHGRWKNHYVIAYGSGNNLIINTKSFDRKNSENLQTLYLESDPSSLDINPMNGYIVMGLANTVVVFTPINEYMKKPRWQKSMVIPVESTVNCVQWAPVESEIVVGTNNSIVLLKVSRDLGQLMHHVMWHKEQPLAVESVKITFNSNKIVAQGGMFERFLKVWSRISYGEDNTMFEVTYLSHDSLDFVTDFKWRFRLYNSIKTVDGSMANIKNIRNYIDSGSDDADTLFTFSHNKVFRVWSTYESSGHSTIKCWGKLDLATTFEDQLIVGVFIVDNYYLQKTLFSQLDGIDSEFASYFKNQRFDNVDLLFVVGNSGQVAIHLILNVSNIPPNSIQFERVDNGPMYFNGNCFLEMEKLVFDMKNPDPTMVKPIIIPKVLIFDPEETKLSLLLHNRVRGTIKFNTLDFTKFLQDDEHIGTKLINKLEGHDKSIRKLVKSDDSVILSILNFGDDNNLWRPLDIDGKVVITKDSYINLNLRSGEKADTSAGLRIVDALILQEHVVTYDSLGYLSVWDHTKEDNDAQFLSTQSLPIATPKFFQQVNGKILIILDKLYCWELKKGVLAAQAIPELPQFHQISKFDDGIALMDSKGVLGKYMIINNNWVESFTIDTSIENCSAAVGFKNKLAFVDNLGTKLFIWDLKSRILEYEQLFDEEVRDIDWCNIGGNMLLSVGFKRSVVLYTELRYDYTNHLPTYSMLKRIDISDYTSHDIGDSVWINDGYLVIGSGNQFFIDDRGFEIGSSSDAINNMTRQLVKGYKSDGSGVYDIRDIVKILNGPLPYYHPQFLVQLLYMNQFDLVHLIVVKLYQKLRSDDAITWFPNFSIIDEVLYGPTKLEGDDVFNTFNDHLLELLVQQLTKTTLPSLTRHQQMTLISLMHILSFIEKYRPLLDDNGVRFLVGFKLFQMSKQLALNMRDINFALHSTNKDLLISIIEETYDYQFSLDLVKSLGLVYWVHNFKLQEIVENLVKNEFNESRDPSGLVSLLYITLNKKQVLVGLWRIVSHREKDKILKFLSNDFNSSRWKTAAMKNAFALLGKHRYLDSAYFFLLGDKVKDCCSMINNKLHDFQLSLLVSKLYNFVRNRDIDNTSLIENYLVQEVIEDGNKWMNSWMFWELGDKNSSIQALIKPPLEVIKPKLKVPSNYTINYSASKFYDPALILLFNSIKSKRKEYQTGSLTIDLKQETDFLLNICLIYTKMGCDYLAVILLKNWKFGEAEVMEKKKKLMEFKAPPAQVFEEPDMSAFDFGF